MTGNIDNAVFEKLSIKISRSPGLTLMTWSGVGDLHRPEAELLSYLGGIVSSLVGQPFTVDFKQTSYLNSSTLSTILVFMRNLHDQKIKTTLQFDAKIDWQRSASRCLRSLRKTLPSVVVQEL